MGNTTSSYQQHYYLMIVQNGFPWQSDQRTLSTDLGSNLIVGQA
jgi:hypothetical protein